ncbi:MAG: retron Ec67 family RNA-directed DNA polymerase/endonuclease [Pseudomonadales bacterium]
MSKLNGLKIATTKKQLASLLGVKTSFLTHTLYIIKPANQYTTFNIPKKSGGTRAISAPTTNLKSLQSCLSHLLLDCVDEINKSKLVRGTYKSTLSHGFVRDRSIITNAVMHLHKRNVLNMDLEDFFGGFNFGRVRGFFIKNSNFNLDPHIATVIAQIACHQNKLPQGSPCSPVITNLITHSLDIKLAALAKKYSCVYTRYADDITFSTRESVFPAQIMAEKKGTYIVGKKLKSEIGRSGFSINQAKTRIQYKDSRQDVTGLIVNTKPNTKREYWRTIKSQCHSLFVTGSFFKNTAAGPQPGNINVLEGQLNFIDYVDKYNRLRDKPHQNRIYALANHGKNTSALHSGREKTFSRFLYYRLFYGNTKPAILCEGKTDNVYIKSAIRLLVASYPTLGIVKNPSNEYELLLRFIEYSERTEFLLELAGGTDYLSQFIYKFDKKYIYYKAPIPEKPVIIVLDNDSGFSVIKKQLNKIPTTTCFPTTLKKDDYENADFIHVVKNLYIVLVPLGGAKEAAIEDLFDSAARLIDYNGKCFNTVDKRNADVDLSKEVFSKRVVKAQKKSINFNGFKPLLDRIVNALLHYDSIR